MFAAGPKSLFRYFWLSAKHTTLYRQTRINLTKIIVGKAKKSIFGCEAAALHYSLSFYKLNQYYHIRFKKKSVNYYKSAIELTPHMG
jgi:hypothetical protein